MYYLHFNKSQYGPYTEEQVRGMVTAGNIPNSALVYDQTKSNKWQPLSKFPHLSRSPRKKNRNLSANPSVTSTPIERSEIERIIWESRPSYLSNIWCYFKYFFLLFTLLSVFKIAPIYIKEYQDYAGYIIACLCLMIILRIIWISVDLKSEKFVLTTERFIYSLGVFSRKTESLELYRIKDLTLRTPFLQRILGYGYVELITSDKTDPNIPYIGIIKKPKDVYETIRKYTERQRKRHGVRELDITL